MKTKYKKEELVTIINECKSYRETVEKLGLVKCGGNIDRIKKIINWYDICTKHFTEKNQFKSTEDKDKEREYNIQYQKEHYKKNKHIYIRKNKERKKRNDIFVSEYKINAGCKVCGYNKHACALDFHHLQNDIQNNYISTLMRKGCSIKTLKKEIEKCMSDVLEKLEYARHRGSMVKYIKNRALELELNFDHFNIYETYSRNRKHKKQLEEIMTEHSSCNRVHLKSRLLKIGLLENKCYMCGQGTTWNNKNLTLHLDHINGISDDNRLENLRMLCPNCHSQTDTFGSKNSKLLKNK